MRRQMALIVRILEWLSEQSDPEVEEKRIVDALQGDNDTDEHRAVIGYHIRLCVQAGYVQETAAGGVGRTRRLQLTWKGHEHLPGDVTTVRIDRG